MLPRSVFAKMVVSYLMNCSGGTENMGSQKCAVFVFDNRCSGPVSCVFVAVCSTQFSAVALGAPRPIYDKIDIAGPFLLFAGPAFI